MTEEMGAAVSADDSDWPHNYFNYFTEIEEHFQRVRGTALFLLSPLDWALIENWKNAGIPLEAVLRGIDEAFEKWRSRKVRRRVINSLAYCSQAVIEQAQRGPIPRSESRSTDAPFTAEELRGPLVLHRPGLELSHLRIHHPSLSSIYLHMQILNVQ